MIYGTVWFFMLLLQGDPDWTMVGQWNDVRDCETYRQQLVEQFKLEGKHIETRPCRWKRHEKL
jgi:hypothetical protein